jgi:hypothetical protein
VPIHVALAPTSPVLFTLLQEVILQTWARIIDDPVVFSHAGLPIVSTKDFMQLRAASLCGSRHTLN